MISAVAIATTIGRMRNGFNPFGGLSENDLDKAHESAPTIIYNGRPDENEALRIAIENGRLPQGFPAHKIHIIDTSKGNEFNSLGQVRDFMTPNGKPKEGDGLGIVARPGQLIRLAHMMNLEENGFPRGVNIKMFPVRTNKTGIPEHMVMEICGIWFYVYSSQEATRDPYPYNY